MPAKNTNKQQAAATATVTATAATATAATATAAVVKSGTASGAGSVATGRGSAQNSKAPHETAVPQRVLYKPTLLGVQQNRVLIETVNREQKCTERFNTSIAYIKQSRNPILGDLTARDDAEYLLPFQHTLKEKMASTAMDGADINAMSSSGKGSSKTLANSGSMVMTGTFNNSSGTMYRARDRIDAMESTRVLRNKKDELDYELEQMQKVIAYKEYCLEKMKGKNELPKRKKELQPVDNMSIIYI